MPERQMPPRHHVASATEWPANLDVAEYWQRGWRPTPISQFILKVHSRCNLACSYCYIYESADQSWRLQPRRMEMATAERAADRIAEHAAAHHLDRVDVVFHGGEPLLAGEEHLQAIALLLRRKIDASVRIAIQTNGVMLDEPMLDALMAHDIRIGVSIDGVESDHNRNRRLPNGQGSHREVARALSLIASPRCRDHFAGLLTTVDLLHDPAATYAVLRKYSPPAIDFLLPHGTWSAPPPGLPAGPSVTPYADWLIPIFDGWYHGGGHGIQIRLFRDIMHLLLGGRTSAETVGLAPAALLVVETDGTWEQVDSLKASYPGAATTGFNIWQHDVDFVQLHPGVVARQIGSAALAGDCLRCRVRDVCGGGYYPHRYSAGQGFRNPSVYCNDLFALIEHVRAAIESDLGKCGNPS